MGYHDDLKTRISFIEVLTSILKQGAEFNSLADTALADRFTTMLDLVAMDTDTEDFPVMMALINAVPPEHLVSRGTCMAVVVREHGSMADVVREHRNMAEGVVRERGSMAEVVRGL